MLLYKSALVPKCSYTHNAPTLEYSDISPRSIWCFDSSYMSFVPDFLPPGWLCGSSNFEFSPKTFMLLQKLHTMVSNNFGSSLSNVLAFNSLIWFRS